MDRFEISVITMQFNLLYLFLFSFTFALFTIILLSCWRIGKSENITLNIIFGYVRIYFWIEISETVPYKLLKTEYYNI